MNTNTVGKKFVYISLLQDDGAASGISIYLRYSAEQHFLSYWTVLMTVVAETKMFLRLQIARDLFLY